MTAPPQVRRGVRIGVDVGKVRVGVARSDLDGQLAVPVETLARGAGDIAAVADFVNEYDALEVLVGLPISLSGREGPAAVQARIYAQELATAVAPVLVRLVDERLSTVQAQRGLRAAGKTTRQSRSVLDQAAAVIIVQHALEAERVAGRPTGTTVRIA